MDRNKKSSLSDGSDERTSLVTVAPQFTIVYTGNKTVHNPLFQLCLVCDDLVHLCTTQKLWFNVQHSYCIAQFLCISTFVVIHPLLEG